MLDSNVPKNVDWIVSVQIRARRNDEGEDLDARRTENGILGLTQKGIELVYLMFLQVDSENDRSTKETAIKSTHPNGQQTMALQKNDCYSRL